MESFKFANTILSILRSLGKKLEPMAAEAKLSITEAKILLFVVHHGNWRMKDLTEHFGHPASTLSGLLDRMTSAGLLERQADPDDRRAYILKPTEAAHAIYHTIYDGIAHDLDAIFASLPEGFVQTLNANLAQVDELLSGAKKEGELK